MFDHLPNAELNMWRSRISRFRTLQIGEVKIKMTAGLMERYWAGEIVICSRAPAQSSRLCPWTWKPPLPDIHPEGPSVQEGPTEHQQSALTNVIMGNISYKTDIREEVVLHVCQLKEAEINDSPWYPSSWGWVAACTKISTTPLSTNSPWKRLSSHFGVSFPPLKTTWCESTVQQAGWLHKFCWPLCCPYTAKYQIS